VLLSVEISAGGRPDSVKIEKSSGYERLDRAAVEAVRRWRFKPATREGQPVAARVNIPVQFKLP
jgi:protein TonB